MITTIAVSPCTPEDYLDVYHCRYDAESIRNSFTANIPAIEEHKAFFLNALKTMKYYKGIINNRFMGFARFRKTEKGTEVSICLHPEFRGKHLATSLLMAAIKANGNCEDMYAEIMLGNVASFKVFARYVPKSTSDG